MAVQYKDYYETLGVSKTATQDEIRKAFRKLARQYHPDVAKDKKTAEAKFKEINEANEVLGDPDKRSRYDQLGADWERGGRQAPPGYGGAGGYGGGQPGGDFSFGGTGFSDFFEQFFSGRTGGGMRRGRPGSAGGHGFGFGGEEQQARGGDIEADLLVTIEEALHGAKKKISFRREDNPKVETYEVKIPTGVKEGQRIRLAGQGGAGSSKALSGDLYLRVKFAQHPDYQIDGTDLIFDLELPVWKVVLGTEAAVTTPDGTVKLKIAPGTQPGRKLRLKGRGMPIGATERGDFYVKIEVTVPTTLTDEERAHWEALSKIEA